MKPINKKNKGKKELSIADLLCTAGYLPPRNEQDLERFERIYRGRKFETESYIVNADAIFDKVSGEEKSGKRRIRPFTTIDDSLSALRVAESTSEEINYTVAEILSQLIKDKKD